MKNDYLWDGSGEPDPEIRRLEALLGGLRHSRPAPEFPPEFHKPSARWAGRRPRVEAAWRWLSFGAAAAVAVLAAGGVLWLSRPKPPLIPVAKWNVSRMEGAPRVDAQTIDAAKATGTLVAGQVIETDAGSKAGISSDEIGEIVVDPGSRLRLVANRSGVRHLALERGTIHASIWAPAGEFVVDTPSATAVDMGCVYTLHVDDSGDGELHTAVGWVGFKLGDREAFIPAGAACATRKNRGPSTPYFEDASGAFRVALSQLDQDNINPEERGSSLRIVLTTARRRDAFTLWHLLSRVSAAERARVYDRLAILAPPPDGVTPEGILQLDRRMLDLWWNEFGLGDVDLWRYWERNWSEQSRKGQ
jgi:hypothetical protein